MSLILCMVAWDGMHVASWGSGSRGMIWTFSDSGWHGCPQQSLKCFRQLPYRVSSFVKGKGRGSVLVLNKSMKFTVIYIQGQNQPASQVFPFLNAFTENTVGSLKYFSHLALPALTFKFLLGTRRVNLIWEVGVRGEKKNQMDALNIPARWLYFKIQCYVIELIASHNDGVENQLLKKRSLRNQQTMSLIQGYVVVLISIILEDM